MHVTFRCPHCQSIGRRDLREIRAGAACETCGTSYSAVGSGTDDARLASCAICGSRDLFVRKDFPQRLGVSIVVLGFAASCVTWYYHRIVLTFGILFATALVDVLLYLLVGDLVECYQCHAQFRGETWAASHERFDLETHERYRQKAARLGGHPPTEKGSSSKS